MKNLIAIATNSAAIIVILVFVWFAARDKFVLTAFLLALYFIWYVVLVLRHQKPWGGKDLEESSKESEINEDKDEEVH